MLIKLRELIWPVLTYGSEAAKQKKEERNNKVLQAIGKATWLQPDVVLEEARRLVLREDERRKTTDTKATIYMGVLVAIVPLLLAFSRDVVSYFDILQEWQLVVLIVVFFGATVYLLTVGVWVFRTLSVGAYDRVDIEELLKLSGKDCVSTLLVKSILSSALRNRDFTNEKVSRLLMAHAFLLRAFVAFVVLVVYLGSITVYIYVLGHWNTVSIESGHLLVDVRVAT